MKKLNLFLFAILSMLMLHAKPMYFHTANNKIPAGPAAKSRHFMASPSHNTPFFTTYLTNAGSVTAPLHRFTREPTIDSIYANAKRRLGPIYNVNPTEASLSLYTIIGSATTWTFTSSGITTSGGDGTVNNRIEYSSYWTNASYYEKPITFISTTAGAGLGTGIYSLSATATLTAHINTSTGALTLEVYRTGTTTTKATATSTLTISDGDTIRLQPVRSMTNFFITAKNLNTGNVISINYTDPYTAATVQTAWSAGHPTIVHYGGSQKIINDSYVVNNIVGNDIVWYGNSIGAGLSAGSPLYAAPNIIGANMNDNVNIIAGGSNRTVDFLRLEKEMLLLKPRMVIHGDGINDIINSIPQDTINAHLAAADKWAHDNGIMMLFNDILPVGPTYGGASNATYQAAIIATNTFKATLSDAINIPTFAAVLNTTTSALDPKYDSGDHLHLNQYGQETVGITNIGVLRNLINISGGAHYSPQGWKSSGAFSGTCCGFVVQNLSQSATAFSGIRVMDNSNVLTANIAFSSSISATAPNDANGARNFQILTASQKAFIGSQSTTGQLNLLVGGVTGASTRVKVTTTANYFTTKTRLGDTTTSPTAWLHIKAGSATAGTGPLRFDSGVLLTVPVAGMEEFLTDRRYFTQTTGTIRQTYAWLNDLADAVNTAADADYTITTAAQLVKLPVITTAHTVILPAAASYTGRQIRIWNQNTSATFLWTFASTVKNNDSTTVTAIANQTWVVLESDGINWNWVH